MNPEKVSKFSAIFERMYIYIWLFMYNYIYNYIYTCILRMSFPFCEVPSNSKKEAAERLRQMPQDLQRRVLDLGDLRCHSLFVSTWEVHRRAHVGLNFLLKPTLVWEARGLGKYMLVGRFLWWKTVRVGLYIRCGVLDAVKIHQADTCHRPHAFASV